MNGFTFCVIADLATCALIAWLGWLYMEAVGFYRAWLVVIMALLTVRFVIPSTDIFICPKCGHVDKVKTYTAAYGLCKTVREDKGEEMELPKEGKQ